MSAPSAPPPTAPVQDDAPDPFPETTVICLICFLVVVPLCFVWCAAYTPPSSSAGRSTSTPTGPSLALAQSASPSAESIVGCTSA
jgi:hypothetical protein